MINCNKTHARYIDDIPVKLKSDDYFGYGSLNVIANYSFENNVPDNQTLLTTLVNGGTVSYSDNCANLNSGTILIPSIPFSFGTIINQASYKFYGNMTFQFRMSFDTPKPYIKQALTITSIATGISGIALAYDYDTQLKLINIGSSYFETYDLQITVTAALANTCNLILNGVPIPAISIPLSAIGANQFVANIISQFNFTPYGYTTVLLPNGKIRFQSNFNNNGGGTWSCSFATGGISGLFTQIGAINGAPEVSFNVLPLIVNKIPAFSPQSLNTYRLDIGFNAYKFYILHQNEDILIYEDFVNFSSFDLAHAFSCINAGFSGQSCTMRVSQMVVSRPGDTFNKVSPNYSFNTSKTISPGVLTNIVELKSKKLNVHGAYSTRFKIFNLSISSDGTKPVSIFIYSNVQTRGSNVYADNNYKKPLDIGFDSLALTDVGYSTFTPTQLITSFVIGKVESRVFNDLSIYVNSISNIVIAVSSVNASDIVLSVDWTE